ncbi:hypothetical protein HLB23_24435 [Nocardia uniformis]|uniref:Uncharacterized protein n=1 Tax=Nocardia uniformis TaxID=53432 RepID=A0A849CD07_9NOCA|nr:hypothetical protein [Nocardia uniformis]NNH72969.1 hypothetical protein [Nocardia uniformis]
MSIEARAILTLVSNLAGGSATARATASDEVTDWTGSFTPQQANVLTSLLLWLASVESDPTALEAELHAAAELVENCSIDPTVINDVHLLNPETLPAPLHEYRDFLLSEVPSQ